MSDDRAYRILLAYDQEKQRFLGRVPELGLETEGENRAAAMGRAEKRVKRGGERDAVYDEEWRLVKQYSRKIELERIGG